MLIEDIFMFNYIYIDMNLPTDFRFNLFLLLLNETLKIKKVEKEK